jgi:hypothetical protein
MNQIVQKASLPPVPPEVWTFAAERGVSDYVYPLLEMTHRAFQGRPLTVLLEEDPEICDDRHIVIEADVTGMTSEEMFTAQRRWSKKVSDHCPSIHTHLFRYGLVETA